MRLYLLTMISLPIYFSQAIIPHEMSSLMDTNVDPCDDFYHYACGNWLKTNPLHPEYTMLDYALSMIHTNNAHVMNDIISENHPVVGEFWDSCMAIGPLTEVGNKPLQKDLNDIVRAKTKSQVLELTGTFARTGTNAMFAFQVKPDPMKATTNVLQLGPAQLGLPDIRYYSNTHFLDGYKTYIHKLMKLSGFSLIDDDHTVVNMVLRIEQHLATIQQYQSLYLMSIDDIITYFPIAAGSYLKGLGLVEKASMKEHFKIYVERVEYFDALEKFIESTSINDLKVYVAFMMVHSRVHWLGKDFSSVWFEFFDQKMHGQQHPVARNVVCMRNLITYLPDLIGKYYYTKAFDVGRKENALEMIKLIQNVLADHISHSTWLSDKAQAAAHTKLNKIIPLVGQSTMPKSYPSSLSHNDYPTNVHTILSHSLTMELAKLGQPVNHEEWNMSPVTTNAMYLPHTNSILFSAAILQPPFFNGPNVHPSRNFGGIGFLMGHELTHGFDSTGQMFDGDGNVRPWWNELTTTVFNIRKKCMVQQYSAFPVKGEHDMIGNVNGNLTLNENIADIGGLALAWDAYRNYMTSFQPKFKDITEKEGDQMFFLAFGQSLCGKTHDENMIQILAHNTHSPHQWRVNGAVMNNDNFPKVFNCPDKSRMNPITKCKLW